jgi:hypothetical protein
MPYSGLEIARILAVAGLATFLIYFIDEIAKNGVSVGGFLPIPSPMARGIAFELPTLALSAASFALSWRKTSVLVSVVLFVTGLLMVIDGISVGTRFFSVLNLPGPVIGFIYGLVVLALGITKSVMTARQRSNPIHSGN